MPSRVVVSIGVCGLLLALPVAAAARPAATRFAPPWARALRFHSLAGWRTGLSGTVHRGRTSSGKSFPLDHPESAAWIANVPYRDPATSDPPQRTVYRMRSNGVVVWAVIWSTRGPGSWPPLDLRLSRFDHGLCCDGTAPPYTRMWDTGGRAGGGLYDAVVRVYFGSRPTRRMLAQARRALRALALPKPRR